MNTVSINTKPGAGFAELAVESSGELMKNWQAADVVDPQHAIDVAQDSDGNPIVLSIGNDGVLYAVYRDTTSHTGWQKMDLSELIGSGLAARAFGIYQANNGKIMLAVSVGSAGGSDNHVYMSAYLDNAPSSWNKDTVSWKERPLADASACVSTFALGADAAGTGTPLVVVAVDHDGQGEHWRVNSDHADDSWNVQPFALPENAVGNLVDLAIGQVEGHQGAYALYKTTTGKSLEFTTLPFKSPHVDKPTTLSFTFDLPGDVNAVQALATSSDTDDLYAAGAGVYRWVGTSRTGQVISSETTAAAKLVVRQDQSHIAIWIVQGDENLVFLHGKRQTDPGWSVALTLGTKVAEIAAIRNDRLQTNELFAVTAAGGLTYYYQDPVSTLWQETAIALPSVDRTIQLNSYTTHINVKKNGNIPLLDKEFQLTASEWTYVTVNHELHVVSPTAAATVKPDVEGVLTIINRVSSLSTPVFHLSADWLDGIVDINPGGNAQAKLESVKSGDDLRAARRSDGTPVVGSSVPPADVDAVGSAIGKLNQLKGQLDVGAPGSQRAVGAATPILLRPEVVGSVGSFGLIQEPTGLRFVGAAEVEGVLSGWGDAVESVAGDVLHSIESGAEELAEFVLNVSAGVAEFYVKLGNKLLKFVIKTVATVYRTISAVFAKILVALEDLMAWLGFIFDWADIKHTHAELKKIVNMTIEFMIAGITNGEEHVKDFFSELKEKIVGKDLAAQLGDNATMPISGIGSKGDKAPLRSDPRIGFVSYHLKNPAAFSSGGDDGNPFSADLVRKLQDSVVQFGEAEIKTIENAITEIANNLHGSVGDAITKITEILTAALLQELENGVLGLMEVSKLFLEAVGAVLNTEWNIPVLSQLYKEFVGSTPSLLDVSCLILAVPITVMYKLQRHKAPFDDQQVAAIARALQPSSTAGSASPAAGVDVAPGDDPPELLIILSFLLGGVCVTIGRLLNNMIAARIAVQTALKVPIETPVHLFRFILSTLTFGGSIANRLLGQIASGSRSGADIFEDSAIAAQIVFPIVHGCFALSNRLVAKVLSVLATILGILNCGVLVVLFILEVVDRGQNTDDFVKFVENVGMTLSQASAPLVSVIPAPRAQVVFILLFVLGASASVALNAARAVTNVSAGRLMSPI